MHLHRAGQSIHKLVICSNYSYCILGFRCSVNETYARLGVNAAQNCSSY